MPETVQQYESSFERIQSSELITGYLRRLKDAHTLLKVTVPDHAAICSSIIVVIKEDENYILLDKLHPESGHQAFMEKKQCTVRASHKGVSMGFAASLEELINHEDSPAYRITFPKEFLYHQKRSAYRAAIGASNRIEVILTSEDNTVFKGTLYNISTGGLGVNLPKKMVEKLEAGNLISSCRFTTSTGITIESAAEVRNVKTDDNKKVYRVGMRFIDISPKELRAVQRFVLTLEREQIKRKR